MTDLFLQKSMDCAKNRGISVFWVAEYKTQYSREHTASNMKNRQKCLCIIEIYDNLMML